MKNIILIIITMFLLVCCTKEGGNIYVEGRVYNPITGEGIEGIVVQLLKPRLGGAPGAQSGGVKTVKKVYTDADGYYSISHLGGLLGGYYVQFEPINEYHIVGIVSNETEAANGYIKFNVDKGKNMEVDFEMVPYGEFKFKIENVNCQGASDYFELFHYGSRFGYKEGLSDEALREGEGCYTYNQNYFAKVPIGGRYYRWEVTRNGITQTYYDTFYVEPNEQKVFTIDY